MLLVTDRTSKLPSELGAYWLMMHSELGGVGWVVCFLLMAPQQMA